MHFIYIYEHNIPYHFIFIRVQHLLAKIMIKTQHNRENYQAYNAFVHYIIEKYNGKRKVTKFLFREVYSVSVEAGADRLPPNTGLINLSSNFLQK